MGVFGNAFSGWHLLLILAVILLLFGAAKLPGLAKSVGESVRILRTESKDSEGTTTGEASPDTRSAEARPGSSSSST